MKYNFDKIINRHGTNAYKWDSNTEKDIIPMWVADMDFQVAQPIVDAVKKRVEHGIFGYTLVPQTYYEAIINWFARKHQWKIQQDWITYTTGVVPALSACIQALTKPGDNVLVQSPIYNCFFSSIKNSGCNVLENPLIYKDQTYTIDYNDFEKKAALPQTKLFLLCNPHNPAARVWTKQEMQQLNDICKKHGVMVVADEIHCELVMPDQLEYTPFASISQETEDNSITCNSPSKSFNIAGLQIANIICSNKEVRRKIRKTINVNEICDVNPLGVEALIAAYNHSEDWIMQLNQYIWQNYNILKEFFIKNMPNLLVTKLEGTYLVWVNIKSTGKTSDEITKLILQKGKVRVNSGTMYSQTYGEEFIRINIACPKQQLINALEGIKKAIDLI